MDKTVVHILSTNYSGSHFLSLLLGSHSCACHLGETRKATVREDKPYPESDCWICDDPKNCPRVRGLKTVPVTAVYRKVFENLSADGLHPDLLVDNSKRVSWAQHFVGDASCRYKYVHLVRDPRALIRRWSNNYQTLSKRLHARRKAVLRGAGMRRKLLFAPDWKIYLHKWYEQNVAIADFLERHDCDFQVVTYRDIATETATELERLVPWLGLDFEPAQIEYWNFKHHGTQKSDYEWVARRRVTGHFDLRWQESLSPELSAAIAGDELVARLSDRLGLAITETGLTRQTLAADSVDVVRFTPKVAAAVNAVGPAPRIRKAA